MTEERFKCELAQNNYRASSGNDVGCMAGGEGGIRTHGGSRPTTVFETAPFGRSGTSPVKWSTLCSASYNSVCWLKFPLPCADPDKPHCASPPRPGFR